MDACPHYDAGEGPTDGLPCQFCEDEKARAWKADGHKLVARFDKHECLMLTIVCPAHEGRECAPDKDATIRVHGNCMVIEELAQVGGDLFDGPEGKEVTVPCDLRWRWHLEYGEEPDIYIEVEFVDA